jgi:hypothetical protein
VDHQFYWSNGLTPTNCVMTGSYYTNTGATLNNPVCSFGGSVHNDMAFYYSMNVDLVAAADVGGPWNYPAQNTYPALRIAGALNALPDINTPTSGIQPPGSPYNVNTNQMALAFFFAEPDNVNPLAMSVLSYAYFDQPHAFIGSQVSAGGSPFSLFMDEWRGCQKYTNPQQVDGQWPSMSWQFLDQGNNNGAAGYSTNLTQVILGGLMMQRSPIDIVVAGTETMDAAYFGMADSMRNPMWCYLESQNGAQVKVGYDAGVSNSIWAWRPVKNGVVVWWASETNYTTGTLIVSNTWQQLNLPTNMPCDVFCVWGQTNLATGIRGGFTDALGPAQSSQIYYITPTALNGSSTYFTNITLAQLYTNSGGVTMGWRVPVQVTQPATTLGSAEMAARLQPPGGTYWTVSATAIQGA